MNTRHSHNRGQQSTTAPAVFCLLVAVLLLPACRRREPEPEQQQKQAGPLDKPFPYSRFVDGQGDIVDLTRFAGNSNVLLVFMRGFAKYICPNCTRQTAELVDHLEAIKETDTEVFIVYPGPAEKIPAFIAEVRKLLNKKTGPVFPIQVLLDVDLKAVRALDIVGNLARPSTFVVDKDGNLAYSYVGSTPSDRPATLDVLAVLQGLGTQ